MISITLEHIKSVVKKGENAVKGIIPFMLHNETKAAVIIYTMILK